MRINKVIVFAGACIFYMGLTTPAAINTDAAEPLTIAESGRQTSQQSRLLIAQDNADVQESGDPELNPENRSKAEAQKKIKPETHPSEAKTDPLPSYEPSEKIKADQAVDFPYDI